MDSKRRSLPAVLAEKYLRLKGWKKKYVEGGYEKYISTLDNKNYTLPKMPFKSTVKKFEFYGSDVYTMSKTDDPDCIIVYLHGGAYTGQPVKFHWKGCDRIVQATNAQVIMPVYPLAPHGTWKETYDLLQMLYGKIILNTGKDVIFMGDSSGGGLILGFCEFLSKTSLPQPSKIIALSPWLDVTMSNARIPDYLENDPMIACYGAIKMGKLWAGDLDTKDYRISPIYGNVEGLHDVYLFVGTREALYPDVTDFYQKLQDNNVISKIYIGEGMTHVFPLYPVPEGKRAMKEICRIINNYTLQAEQPQGLRYGAPERKELI
ncbi:MAG: alpha/beta hydrolase [Clostridia bacterium]|nr:alpha/beta hydrolase [Clostridia bacterium]